jgi:hypothetical protein
MWSNLRLVTVSNNAVISLRIEAPRLPGDRLERNRGLGWVADVSKPLIAAYGAPRALRRIPAIVSFLTAGTQPRGRELLFMAPQPTFALIADVNKSHSRSASLDNR